MKMKPDVRLAAMTITWLAGALMARAADFDDSWNRFTLAPRVGLNIKASFQSTTLLPPAPAAGPNVARNYDNGYVRVDNSGNAGGMSSLFRFDQDAQYNPLANAGNGTLSYNFSTSPLDGRSSSFSQDAMAGGQLGYERTLVRLPIGKDRKIRIALGAAYNYSWLDVHGTMNGAGPVTTVSDTFNLNGVPLPMPSVLGGPYQGSPDGGLALINATPARTLNAANFATATSRRTLEGNVYGLKLGPVVDIPLFKKLSLGLQGGWTMVYVDWDLKSTESLNVAGYPSAVMHDASLSGAKWLSGPYLGGQLQYDLGGGWSAYAGAEWQNLGSKTFGSSIQQATLGMDSTIFVNAGISLSF